MRLHDLGPISIETAGVSRPLAGRRVEAVLAALLVRRGEIVSTDWLIDAVWGEDPPPRAAAALDTLIWRLRRFLEPQRPARSPSTVLRTEDPGFRLLLHTDQVDSAVLAAYADRLGTGGDPAQRVAESAAVLDLWRGNPYETVADTGWLDPVRTRLAEQRLAVLQDRIDALLETGQPERAVTELVPVIAEHPFVERLREQRVLGLQRAGRPADAVAAYREYAELLDAELGAAPGGDLQALVGRLGRAAPVATTTTAVYAVPHRRTSMLGRADDLAAVRHGLRRQRQVSVVGPVGCGKTRLSIAVAEALRLDYADGVVFVDLTDLTGAEPADAVAGRVQEALQIPADPQVPPVAAVAAFTADRQVLVVLDNCEQVTAAAAEITRTVLAGDRAAVLATSRQPLDLHGELVHVLRPLPLPHSASPADLAGSPAAALLVERLAEERPTADLEEAERAAVLRICTATDGLPLGIELAAALRPVLQLHEIADALDGNQMGLRRPGRNLRDASRAEATLRDSIDWSHGLLTGDERVVHRRLSVLPPGFTLESAAAVCSDDELTAEEVPHAVAGLSFRSLLVAVGPYRPGGPSVFRQLVPIREHAGDQLRTAGESGAVTDRRDRWVRSLLMAGPRPGQSGQAEHYLHIDDHLRAVTASLGDRLAETVDDADVLALCRLLPYWLDRMIGADAVRLATAVRKAVGPANSAVARALAVAVHGCVLAANQEVAEVRAELVEAVSDLTASATEDLPRETRRLIGDTLTMVTACCWVGDDYELAAMAADAAAGHGTALQDDHIAVVAAVFASSLQLFSDPGAARSEATVLVERAGEVGNNLAALMATVTLSVAALLDGDGPAGLGWTDRTLRLHETLGVWNIADTLETRGNHYVNAGMPVEALRCYGASHLQNSRVGRTWPRHPGTAEKLDGLRDTLSSNDFQDAWASGERLGADNLVEGWL
ncbi:hypothetical protein GIS00_14340 [Nakamurella sp. YIM 132087]|uniref:OmpR/PhoB-type domain-containing protein n=1 Tax=Nakamurella alba TaxID=2665158 RepID=A0A7K1FP66_9ACTN|nr:BTAD domain-containing putative transcriptional regulator [Nakamurella alba]MTD15119.1 hypothetical protein [Nakamurella alba]